LTFIVPFGLRFKRTETYIRAVRSMATRIKHC